jgi:hypothetical protein
MGVENSTISYCATPTMYKKFILQRNSVLLGYAPGQLVELQGSHQNEKAVNPRTNPSNVLANGKTVFTIIGE